LPDYKRPLTLILQCDDLNRPLTNLVNESSVRIALEPTVEFLSLVDSHNFVQRGKFSWALSTNDNHAVIARFLKEYSKDFLPGTMASSMEQYTYEEIRTDYALSGTHRTTPQPALQEGTAFRDALGRLGRFRMPKVESDRAYVEDINSYYRRGAFNAQRRKELVHKYSTLGGVHVELKNDLLWVRLYPTAEIATRSHQIQMPKVKNVRYPSTVQYPPRQAIMVVKELIETHGENVFDERSAEVFELLDKTRTVVSVGYAPNKPASVILTRGEHVPDGLRSPLKKFKYNEETTVPMSEVLRLQNKMKSVEFLVHPGLSDVVSMANSEPYDGDDRLKPYQREAVGLHLSTKIGYLQTCSTGMGKTVMQLTAMRAKAKTIENYRGIVVTEANVRVQWTEEAAKWFPEAEVFVVATAKDVDGMAEALGKEGPVVVVVSYAHTLLALEEQERRDAETLRLSVMTYAQRMKALQASPIPEVTVGALLLDSRWEDICADEAVVIRNGSSKQSNIMWTLRKNSRVATALTATPINKSADDIGRLISWVRNDKTMFSGKPLSEEYDTTTVEGAKKLFKIFGPLVFRRDTSEISDEIPTVNQDVRLLEPSTAEKALAVAAEHELKRCYLELVAALDEVEKVKSDNAADREQLQKVREELRAANGAWLGGTQLARMATSDPAALHTSGSVGAALLAGQGLIEAAMQDEPTKRKAFVADALKRIAAGQQILVFTEFATVAELLVEALEAIGIKAKAYTGKNGSVRDRARKEFQDGDLDVLVCTKAGNRGLTLHKAAAIYHYDLPWTLENIIQRTGRAVRIGSENPEVDIVFLIMSGTVEHRMANHLVTQGISASLVMDHSRGADLKQTETATAMSGLISAMAKKSDDKSVVEFGKLLLGV